MNVITAVLIIGIGATFVTDLWGLARRPLFGVAPPNYGLVGRWLGHMRQGRFRHDAISKARPVMGELAIGWFFHYLTGIAYAALLVGIWGLAWVRHPTPGPALIVGIGTVLAPFLLMQPGMGAGIAASRTPRPAQARLHSLLLHVFFGLGLYVSALAACFVLPQ